MSIVLNNEQYLRLGVYALSFLNYCQENRNWVRITGNLSGTCGYTGPGFYIVLRLFEENGIYDDTTFRQNIARLTNTAEDYDTQRRLLVNIVNETIGHLFDLSDALCPITGLRYGLSGLAQKEKDTIFRTKPANFYRIATESTNLVPGANLITFTFRGDCETIHHATLYFIPNENVCYITDSWATSVSYPGFECRLTNSRRYNMSEVITAINILNNTANIELTRDIMAFFFHSHSSLYVTMLTLSKTLEVHTTRPEYIKDLYEKVREAVLRGDPTLFGGKHRLLKTRNKTKINRKTGKRKL